MPAPFPARLHVLLARDAGVGVVIRRGPADSVCTVHWDRRKDRFTAGQWLRGRIYERRSDLSPDGRHLIYFVKKGPRSWTAVSRAPWLKAVTFLEKGDCWQGGGLFTSNSTYWLNGCHYSAVGKSAEVRPDPAFKPPGHYGAECTGVYYVRLQRDGWNMLPQENRTEPAIFEKLLPKGWILRKFAHADVNHPRGTGCYWDEHELENAAEGQLLSFPTWEWAELEGKALVWAEHGYLKRAAINRHGPGEAHTLCNFNEMKFEARQAPY